MDESRKLPHPKYPTRYWIQPPSNHMSLAHRAWQMWAVHPADLDELNMDREQFYLAHVQAVQNQVQHSHDQTLQAQAWQAGVQAACARLRDQAHHAEQMGGMVGNPIAMALLTEARMIGALTNPYSGSHEQSDGSADLDPASDGHVDDMVYYDPDHDWESRTGGVYEPSSPYEPYVDLPPSYPDRY